MWYHGFEWSCAVCGVCHGHFRPALWGEGLCGCGAMWEWGCVRMKDVKVARMRCGGMREIGQPGAE